MRLTMEGVRMQLRNVLYGVYAASATFTNLLRDGDDLSLGRGLDLNMNAMTLYHEVNCPAKFCDMSFLG